MQHMQIIPDGRSGGNRNYNYIALLANDYTRWEIGGEPQLCPACVDCALIIPLGDRGGTATMRDTNR